MKIFILPLCSFALAFVMCFSFQFLSGPVLKKASLSGMNTSGKGDQSRCVSEAVEAVTFCGSIALFCFGAGLLDYLGLAAFSSLFPIMVVLSILLVVQKTARQEPMQRGGTLFLLLGFFLLLALHSTLGESKVFNADDDLAKYFVQVKKIFMSGSSYLGPMGPTNDSSLGLAPFLQSFYFGVTGGFRHLAYWDLSLAFALWVVFGFLSRVYANALSAVVFLGGGILLLLCFHMMYVNISAIYTPAVISIIVAYYVIRDSSSDLCVGVVASFFYGCALSAVWTLKGTFLLSLVVISCCHLLFLMASSFKLAAIRGFALFLGCSLIHFVWSLHWAGGGELVSRVSGLALPASGVGNISSSFVREILAGIEYLISPLPSFYGFGGFSNLAICALCIIPIVGVLIVIGEDLRRRSFPVAFREDRDSARYIFIVAFFSLAALLAFLVLSVKKFGGEEALPRYVLNNLIFIPGVTLVFLSRNWESSGFPLSKIISASVFWLFIGVSLDPFLQKFNQTLSFGNMLSFPAGQSEVYRSITDNALSNEFASFYQELQSYIVADEPVAALVGAPFLLDFERNEVATIEPTAGGSERTKAFLESGEIRYLLRQSKGTGVRTSAQWRQVAESSPFRSWALSAADQWDTLDIYFSRCELVIDSEFFQLADLSRCLSSSEDL